MHHHAMPIVSYVSNVSLVKLMLNGLKTNFFKIWIS